MLPHIGGHDLHDILTPLLRLSARLCPALTRQAGSAEPAYILTDAAQEMLHLFQTVKTKDSRLFPV